MTLETDQQATGRSSVDKVAQCQCGQLRAVVTGEPKSIAMCHCHCLTCKRRSGSAFAYNVFF
jgi:hypothetical protein